MLWRLLSVLAWPTALLLFAWGWRPRPDLGTVASEVDGWIYLENSRTRRRAAVCVRMDATVDPISPWLRSGDWIIDQFRPPWRRRKP
jgi:hypothetical protein